LGHTRQADLKVPPFPPGPWFNEASALRDQERLNSLRVRLQEEAQRAGKPWQPEDGYHVYYTRCIYLWAGLGVPGGWVPCVLYKVHILMGRSGCACVWTAHLPWGGRKAVNRQAEHATF